MWVEELPNGKYKYVERYTDPETHKQKRVSLVHTKYNNRVEKEMLGKLQERIEKKMNGQNLSKGLTLHQLTAEWLTVYKESVKLSSYSRAKSNLNSLNKALGDIQASNVKASHINQYFLTNLQSNQFKYHTANQVKSQIARVLSFGQTFYGLQTKDIIEALEVPKVNVTKKNELNYLERGELLTVVNYLNQTGNNELRRMVILQANTGMRYGEMVSLNYKDDINFDESSITINKTYDFINNVYTSPKTGDERVIYFSHDIGRLLKEQITHTQLLTMSRGIDKKNTQLFKTMHGNIIQHRALNDKLAVAGINKKATTHTLRHTFVSLAVEKGINKDLIAKQVGHSDTKMIDEIYSHFTDGMQKQQKEAMLDFKII